MKTKLYVSIFSLVIAFAGISCAQVHDSSNDIKVINKGIGGNSAMHGWSRFERDVVSQHPDHLVIYFGINDACNHNIPLLDFENTLRQMIERSNEVGIKTTVLVTPNPVIAEYVIERHPEHSASLNLQKHLSTYAEVVRKLANEYNLPLVDLELAVNEHGGATSDATSLLRNQANSHSRDGVHLTPQGYEILAKIVTAALEDKVQPGETVLCLGDSLTYGAHMKGAGTTDGEPYPAQLKKSLNTSKDSESTSSNCGISCLIAS